MKMMMPLSTGFLWITCFLIYNMWNMVLSEFIVKPQNTLAKLGKEISLDCCSLQNNSTLEWKFQEWKNDDSFIKLCSQKTCRRDGYSIDSNTPGCSRLIINSSLVEVAGVYQCNELGTEFLCGAHLVIYQLYCSHNISSKDELVEGQKAVFTCTVFWNGKLPFKMVAMTAGGKEIQKILFSQRLDSYSMSLPVDLLRPSLPSHTFSIQLLTTGIRPTAECIDTHSPVVNWSSPEEQVMYPVTNIRTNCPKKDCEKKKGDLIHCSADGFPLPEFQWLDWDLKPVANSSVLQVNDIGEFTCVSRNTINGQEYEAREKIVVTNIRANCPERTEGMSLSTVIGIFVVAISIHIIIRVLELANIRKFLLFANVCFKKIKNICTCSESGTRTPVDDTPLDDTPLEDTPLQSSVQAESNGHLDHNPKEVNKAAEEAEGLLFPGQVIDADFGISIDDGAEDC